MLIFVFNLVKGENTHYIEVDVSCAKQHPIYTDHIMSVRILLNFYLSHVASIRFQIPSITHYHTIQRGFHMLLEAWPNYSADKDCQQGTSAYTYSMECISLIRFISLYVHFFNNSVQGLPDFE